MTSMLSALRAVQEDIVAMIGPSTSRNVHVSNTVFAGMHIPQLAPTATDPTLVPYEYPFLARVSFYRF